MERGVRKSLGLTFIILTLGIFVEVKAQPVVVTNVPNNSTNFTEIGDLVYFTAGEALWRTDGTASGTFQLVASGFNQGNLWKSPSYARSFNGYAFLVNGGNRQLWRSDGTPSGTILLKTSPRSSISMIDTTANHLFFVSFDDATGEEIYRTDGTTAGTILLRDVNPGPESGYRGLAAAVNNELFFSGNNEVNGTELWKSNGTSAGTVMVKDIYPGEDSGFITPMEWGTYRGDAFGFNSKFYFRGRTPENGMNPWISDGTAAGTHILTLAGGAPQYAIENNGYLYFMTIDDDAYEQPGTLWKTQGTAESTSRIKIIGGHRYGSHTYDRFLVYHDKVYFWHHVSLQSADSLWVTDGTTAGTYSIFNFLTYGIDGNVSFFEEVNDYLLFTGTSQGMPHDFYRSDGTVEGTQAFTDFKAIPRDITKISDFAFYADHDGFTEGTPGTAYSEEDYYHLFQADGNTSKSMRTLWGVNTIGTDNIEGLDGVVIFTTQNDQSGSTNTQKRLWRYDPSTTPPPAATFTLVDASEDKDVKRLLDGSTIVNGDDVPINIRYTPEQTPGSVVFRLNGMNTRTETAPPYSLAGDVDGDYAPWQGAQPGNYTLTATPYSGSGGTGTPGESLTINFTIEEGGQSEPEECTAAGTILREYWDNVSGNSVSSIPINSTPTSTSQLTIFEGPTNVDTNYGARIRGYICPPATGSYTFWIASNDNSELWLSTDDNPANRRRIASVTGATNPREWSKYSSQKSAVISLTAGQRYYIEALHKQGAGTDNVAVGWQLPGGALERPIPGSRLSPFSGNSGVFPAVQVTRPRENQHFTTPVDILLQADALDDKGITKVEFWVSENENPVTLVGEDSTEPYSYLWEGVGHGGYDIFAYATDTDGNTGKSRPVHITVHAGGCTASGAITRDYWRNVSGDRVSNVPVNSPPTSTNELTIFEGPSNIGDNYATRIRGYICPPVTGNYNFWIASNDHSELWLSTDDDPANKVLIAWVTGATNPRQWTKYGSQRSTARPLVAGQRYYIEALHKEGVGTDHIAVGWTLPDGTLERPISGSRLSPFENGSARMASEEATSEETSLYSQINVYPNPIRSGDPELTISGYEDISETVDTEVEIINLTGEVVFSEKVSCGGACSAYLMRLNKQLVPGVYLVNLRVNGARFSRRLLVK